METKPTPQEAKRLQDLAATGIMDTLPESQYDDIALLASYICQAPIAYISFIDDTRQWYKSRINVPFTQTTLEEALCSHTIKQGGLVHVPDMTENEYFKDNPIVKSDLGIRFYAGYPLINSEGSTLGTLCVIDFKKRELDQNQQQALAALGRQVISQLELRTILNHSYNQALHDVLTGLPNRLLLTERIAQSCRQASLTNTACTLLFIDLDNFKQINDTHGHSAGDIVLKEIGKRLRTTLRNQDVIGRYGGDEFLAIINDSTNFSVVTNAVDAIQKSLEQPIIVGDHQLVITASIGSSAYPDHASSTEELLTHADSALYTSKRTGKAKHSTYQVQKS